MQYELFACVGGGVLSINGSDGIAGIASKNRSPEDWFPPMDATQVVQIDDLQVRYGDQVALRIDHMEIPEGKIIGIIGENGAGKSTFINCLLDEIAYHGSIQRSFDSRDVGVLFQKNSYDGLMKVKELISIVTKKSATDESLSQWINEFSLGGLLNKRVVSLSGGEQQRLTLCLVPYLNPSVLFLDELTTGLDYERRQQLLRIVRRFSADRTVFSVSHYFEELEDWVQYLLVLHQGAVLYWGSVEELRKLYPHYSLLQVDCAPDGIVASRHFYSPVEKSYLIVAGSMGEQNAIAQALESQGIRYLVQPCGIRSLYLLLLNDWSHQ